MNIEYPKFIVYEDEIILGHVEFHCELLPNDCDITKVCGGGLFKIDSINKLVLLYGTSMQFGTCSPESIQSAIINGLFVINYEDFIFIYSYGNMKYRYDSNGKLIN